MNNNISHIRNCYGCGVCATVCKKNIISIKLNINGFYEPIIENLELCTNCGLCKEVCAFSNRELSLTETNIISYAAWSNDVETQYKCSSGGLGFEIAKMLISKGYKVCAVRYNAEKQIAEHYIASTHNELIASIGSKYIQSYTVDGFKQINRKEKYLITGTPCQIDSFRRYIQKFRIEEKFILLDFFCHSVPSMWSWKKYIKMMEKKIGNITNASWRNKINGWQDSWVISMYGNKTNSISFRSKGDLFYKLFLEDYCCNPACQINCKYKYKSSSADIRIGDLWGNTYKNNNKGVSALITFTQKGANIIKELDNCTLIPQSFEIVAEGQMKANAGKANLANISMLLLRSSIPMNKVIWHLLFFTERVFRFIRRKCLKKK